jgi:hypothetical protein
MVEATCNTSSTVLLRVGGSVEGRRLHIARVTNHHVLRSSDIDLKFEELVGTLIHRSPTAHTILYLRNCVCTKSLTISLQVGASHETARGT